jgi:hypothetical protein
MATVNSVLLLLASNECNDDEECEQLMLRLGKLILFCVSTTAVLRHCSATPSGPSWLRKSVPQPPRMDQKNIEHANFLQLRGLYY